MNKITMHNESFGELRDAGPYKQNVSFSDENKNLLDWGPNLAEKDVRHRAGNSPVLCLKSLTF